MKEVETLPSSTQAAFEQIREMIRGRRAAALKVENGFRKISVSFVGSLSQDLSLEKDCYLPTDPRAPQAL